MSETSMEDNDIHQVGDNGPDLDDIRGALSSKPQAPAKTEVTPKETKSDGAEDTSERMDVGHLNAERNAEDLEATGSESDVSTEDETAEGSEETSEESEEQVEQAEEDSDVKSVKMKNGDKELSVPRDAQVEVTVNGKKETMSLQEVINKASGAINVDRENARIGRERKKLAEDIGKYKEQASKVNENLKIITEMQDPYEFCAYYGMMKGQDPAEVWQNMLGKTAEWVDKLGNMTEKERELHFENSAHRFRQKIADRQRTEHQMRQQAEQQRQTILTTLKDEGLTTEDYHNTLNELLEMDKRGEFPEALLDADGNIDEMQVVNYTVAKQHQNRIESIVEKINPKLKGEAGLLKNVSIAVLKTESLTGERMTDSEVTKFVKAALGKEQKGISERLSTKETSRVSKSKNANSPRQKRVASSLRERREWQEERDQSKIWE